MRTRPHACRGGGRSGLSGGQYRRVPDRLPALFMETIGGWADAMGFGANVGQYMIVGLVGANFIFELLFNVVLSPVVVRLIRIGKKEV